MRNILRTFWPAWVQTDDIWMTLLNSLMYAPVAPQSLYIPLVNAVYTSTAFNRSIGPWYRCFGAQLWQRDSYTPCTDILSTLKSFLFSFSGNFWICCASVVLKSPLCLCLSTVGFCSSACISFENDLAFYSLTCAGLGLNLRCIRNTLIHSIWV